MVKVVQDAAPASATSEIAVLQAIMEIFAADARRGKPRWRTMLADYLLNVQPTPIRDRVERARAHLIRAEQELIARRRAPAAAVAGV